MTSSATNSQSGSSNRLLNDLPHPDPESGVISIKCLRKIFKSHGECCAAQPWEVIVTTLTMLTLVLTGLGKQMLDSQKKPGDTAAMAAVGANDGCTTATQKSVSSGFYSDETDFAGDFEDDTQMEKIVMAFVRMLAVLHLCYRFKKIHSIGSTFIMKIAITYLCVTLILFGLVAFSLSDRLSLRYRLIYDSWFLVILLVDLPRVTRMSQFALSSSHHRRISENVSHGMFVLAPTFTLETVAKVLLVSFLLLTGIPKLEVYAWFGVVLTLVNFLVYMTFFPAALSLILELMYTSDGRPRWDVRQIIQSLPSEDGYSPAVHKVRVVGTAALIILHVVLRRPITFEYSASSENYSTMLFLLYLIGNNIEQLFYVSLMTVAAVKYLFYEDMDEVSELRRTYIEELTRRYEADSEVERESSYNSNSSEERPIDNVVPENINLIIGENDMETDEGVFSVTNSIDGGISHASNSVTHDVTKETRKNIKSSATKRKFLPVTGDICVGGSDSSSESAWSGINMTANVLENRNNARTNSDSISSSDVEQEQHPASSISSRRSSESVHMPTDMRSLEECVRLLRMPGEAKNLSDDEILQLLESKHIRLFDLERALDDHERGVEVRRKMVIRQTSLPNSSIKAIPYRNYDYERVLGACCENVIGFMTVPLGIVGPLKLDDKFYTVPMATTEGCLLASTNRGCSALKTCGVKSYLTDDGMTRAPVVRFNSAGRAVEAKRWIEDEENYAALKRHFDSTSRFARLRQIFVKLNGRQLFLRFKAVTGDAMGMNMVSKATEFTLKRIMEVFTDMEIVALSGNFCTDKKPAAINWIMGRGKSVVCEATIPKDVVEKTLKTTAAALVDLNIVKNKTGSAMAGSIGGNSAHPANIVTAIYIATGQDAAQNVCSGMCSTEMEAAGVDGRDLYISCTMPCIEVGTVGGGTVLASQSACLEMLGVKGSHPTSPGENATQLAKIVCATVLAGELSLMSALAAGHLVKSHLRHNRSVAQFPPSMSTPLMPVKEVNVKTLPSNISASALSSTLCAALLSPSTSNSTLTDGLTMRPLTNDTSTERLVDVCSENVHDNSDGACSKNRS